MYSTYNELSKKEKADFAKTNSQVVHNIIIALCSNSSVVTVQSLQHSTHNDIVDNAVQIAYEIGLVENAE